MVFGFLDGSMVIFAFRKICPAVVTVVSSPLQILFICLSISSGIGWPSAMPDIIDHSPCNWAMSFLTASLSAAAVEEMVTVASQMRNPIGIILVVFMSVSGSCDVLLCNLQQLYPSFRPGTRGEFLPLACRSILFQLVRLPACHLEFRSSSIAT